MDVEAMVTQAMEALSQGDPQKARELFGQAQRQAGDRPDLLHAIGAVELQLGAPGEARPPVERALALLEGQQDPQAVEMRAHFTLTLGAIEEAQDRPAAAMAAFERVLRDRPGDFQAQSARATLQLSLGQLQPALEALKRLTESGSEQAGAASDERAKMGEFASCLQRWLQSDEHPRTLLEAHREGYCRFFDHHATQMAEKGWIAEAARMKRDQDGQVVLDLPPGARPYAGVRVDLVDPATGQAGQVGDQPMVVAKPGYQPLASTAVLLPWPNRPFPTYVSTQAPWDQLPIQILLEQGDPLQLLDPAIGQWFSAGFNGAFGAKDQGRFHYISDPELRGSAAVYHVDLGRARLDAIDDLLRRLGELHGRHPLRQVILGRGHLAG